MHHTFLFALLWQCGALVQAHSWIDNLSQSDNLSNVGFIRGYEGHTDAISSFLIQSNASSQVICKPNQQTQSYSSTYPMLTLPAGKSFIANYSENGHVTKDALAPDGLPHPGTYTWFLSPNSVETPNPIGTYGAALESGTIIAAGSFDDGLCAEDSSKGRTGPRMCQSLVTIPETLASGTYQVIWLWTFPKVQGVVEMYSSCMDIRIASPEKSLGGPVHAIAQITSPVSSTTSDELEQSTRTSTIYVTTRVYTTIDSATPYRLGSLTGTMEVPGSQVSSLVPTQTTIRRESSSTMSASAMSTSLRSEVNELQTRTTTVTNDTIDFGGAKAVVVSTMVEEAPQNPLADVNNVVYMTHFVTRTVEAPNNLEAASTTSTRPSRSTSTSTVEVEVVVVMQTAYVTVTAG